MDPGVARALGAMYKQVCWAFKVAGCWGAWWRATNGIVRPWGPCRRSSWRQTGRLAEAAVGRTRPTRAATPRRSQSCSCSCRRRARGWWPLGHRAMPMTPGSGAGVGGPLADCPQYGGLADPDGAGRPRGQALLLVTGEGGARAILLRGLPIPAVDCFRQLWVDVAVGDARSTGLVLARHLEAARSVL